MEFIINKLDKFDIEMIKVFQNYNFFLDIKKNVNKCYDYYYESKHFFFNFKLNKFYKKYESKYVIDLITKKRNPNDTLDFLFITYFFNIDYFINIYKSHAKAINKNKKCMIYFFNFKPNEIFYLHDKDLYKKNKYYNTNDILNLFKISNYLQKKNIPLPSYIHFVNIKPDDKKIKVMDDKYLKENLDKSNNIPNNTQNSEIKCFDFYNMYYETDSSEDEEDSSNLFDPDTISETEPVSVPKSARHGIK